MTISRRGLFGRAAGAAALAPFAGKAMAQSMPAYGNMPNQYGMIGGDVVERQLPPLLSLLQRRSERRSELRNMANYSGLSFDVQAARSWSPWFKANVEMARRDEERSIMETLWREFNGK